MPLIQKVKFLKAILLAACILMPWNATAMNHGSMTDQLLNQKFGRNLVENLLVKSLLETTEGKTKQAFVTVNELIRTAPNFKLAYLIRGNLLTTQGHALETFGDSHAGADNTPNNKEIDGLRDEAPTRIEYYLSTKKTTQQPNLLVKLGAEQAQDTDAYLNFYSKKFFYSNGGFEKWADYKRGIQASKPKVSIQIEDVSMFAYPAAKQPVIVVNFEQNFKSSSLQNTMRKRQYWMFDNNHWKIIYEGVA